MTGEASTMQLDSETLTQRRLEELAKKAWEVRENAFIFGNTKVGAAAMARDGSVFGGCNVEHQFRSHDVHAEVNAIGSMVTAGHTDLIAIVVAADRERFTPCGGCMDWIYQFGGPECLVGFQRSPEGEISIFRANELMPFYPA